MKYGIYTIRDQLVGFLSPTIAKNDDVAIRQFSMLVNNDEGTLVSETPQYFDLYKVGDYCDDDGSIVPVNPVELVVTGLSVKKGDDNGRETGKKVSK